MTHATDPWHVLTAHQADVARRFLAERARERRHLVIADAWLREVRRTAW